MGYDEGLYCGNLFQHYFLWANLSNSLYFRQNLHILENMKDVVACGRTYGNIGNSYYMLGDYATAVYYHNKRLDIARRYGDRAAMRRAYTNLGNAYIFLSETAKALEYYRLALSVAAELHDEVIEAQCCFNVGNGAAICGDHGTATEYHIRYLKLARNLGDRTAELRACAALVIDFRKQRMVEKAIYFCVLQGHISIEVHYFLSFIYAVEIFTISFIIS
ncbi:unnamed protein product [Onchocerca flexuosa]|uniref:TPR_REGION domain-containing protein n=1 Tax=Onchocerca flexuosa TaxID=387005 RepID=A0A183H8G1_9BILA|nr:unnamed protein product [Onchocerca flexuosa]